jgi:hypothetical protein
VGEESAVASHVLMVMSNPVEGREDEYNEWYDNVHLGEVLQVPGFVAARRYAAAGSVRGGDSPYRYLSIYEIEADDLESATAALQAAVRGMRMSDAIDTVDVAAWGFTAVGERQVSA